MMNLKNGKMNSSLIKFEVEIFRDSSDDWEDYEVHFKSKDKGLIYKFGIPRSIIESFYFPEQAFIDNCIVSLGKCLEEMVSHKILRPFRPKLELVK